MNPNHHGPQSAVNNLASQAVRPLSMTTLAEELGKALERLEKTVDSMRYAADAMHGGEPRAVAGDGNKVPESGSVLGKMRDQSMRLHALLNQLDNEVDRIRSGI